MNPPLITVCIVTGSEYKHEAEVWKEQWQEKMTVLVLTKEGQVPVYNEGPIVYFSLGENWADFPNLCSLPLHKKKAWIHLSTLDSVTMQTCLLTWLHSTEPLPHDLQRKQVNKCLGFETFKSNVPLVSFFTTTYKSGNKIKRPYQSLLLQNYVHWEWIIVDDSGDDDATYRDYLLQCTDERVKIFRQKTNTGYIGTVKGYAAGLCNGDIVVELDHDDILTPHCTEKIVNAFMKNPDCGFAYGDFTEVYEEPLNDPHWYGWDAGYLQLMYWREYVHDVKRWENIARTPDLNCITIKHLIGLPNHPRAWTRACYQASGGHRKGLSVADDYDLLVRTFLITRFVHIPHNLYIQYKNSGGNNFTNIRNGQIQDLVSVLEMFYSMRILERFKELKMPITTFRDQKHIWECDNVHPLSINATKIALDDNKKTTIIPIVQEYQKEMIARVDTFLKENLKEFIENPNENELVVIGASDEYSLHCIASKLPSGTIRWWPLHLREGTTLEDCLRWGYRCVSGSKVDVLLPASLEKERKVLLERCIHKCI